LWYSLRFCTSKYFLESTYMNGMEKRGLYYSQVHGWNAHGMNAMLGCQPSSTPVPTTPLKKYNFFLSPPPPPSSQLNSCSLLLPCQKSGSTPAKRNPENPQPGALAPLQSSLTPPLGDLCKLISTRCITLYFRSTKLNKMRDNKNFTRKIRWS
jgi:hypothetical protein